MSTMFLDSFQLIVAIYLLYLAIKGQGKMYQFFDIPQAEQPRVQKLLRRTYLVCGLLALLDAGVTVPGDISVMSMDGFNLAAVHVIPLTAMHVPRDELGAEALRVLQQRMASPEAPFRHILLGGKLFSGSTVKRPTTRKTAASGNRHHGLYGDLAT